jgi:hypothetical protein
MEPKLSQVPRKDLFKSKVSVYAYNLNNSDDLFVNPVLLEAIGGSLNGVINKNIADTIRRLVHKDDQDSLLGAFSFLKENPNGLFTAFRRMYNSKTDEFNWYLVITGVLNNNESGLRLQGIQIAVNPNLKPTLQVEDFKATTGYLLDAEALIALFGERLYMIMFELRFESSIEIIAKRLNETEYSVSEGVLEIKERLNIPQEWDAILSNVLRYLIP